MADNQFTAITPKFRVLFPRLFEPDTKYAKKDGGEYKLTMVFDINDELKEFMKVAGRAAKDKFPDDEIVWWTDLRKSAEGVHLPFYKGDEFADKKGWEFARGKCIVRSKTEFAPLVCDEQKKEIIDRNKVYGGCYGFAQVNFAAYEGNGANIPDCVTAYLNAFMRAGDGERIGGRTAKDVFAGVEGGDVAETDLDDEIPF